MPLFVQMSINFIFLFSTIGILYTDFLSIGSSLSSLHSAVLVTKQALVFSLSWACVE